MTVSETKVQATMAQALSALQRDLGSLPRNRTVKFRTRTGSEWAYSYATLDAVTDMLRAALPKHGLAYYQTVRDGCMDTVLLHQTGESITITVPFPASFQSLTDPQDVGKLLTYYRRYSLCLAFGLAADDDDDTATLHPPSPKPAARKPAPPASPERAKPFATFAEADAALLDCETLASLQGVAARIRASQFSDDEKEQLKSVYLEQAQALADPGVEEGSP